MGSASPAEYTEGAQVRTIR